MKLTKELKEKIDRYFDNISAEELYNLAVNKYGFTEVIDCVSFETIQKRKYVSHRDSFNTEDSSIPFAA